MPFNTQNKLRKRVLFLGTLFAFFALFQDGVYAKEEAEILVQTGHTSWVNAVAFSPDGTQIISGGGTTLRLWDRATGQLVRTFKGHTASVKAVAFSPDGSQVLSGSADNTLGLWDRATGQLVRTFKGHTQPVNAVAFSPDGTQVLSGGSFRDEILLRLWDRATGQLVRNFESNTDTIASVAFSPDGTQVLAGAGSGNTDITLLLWDRATGELLRTFEHPLENPFSPVNSVAFSPDGTQVLAGVSGYRGVETPLRLWDRTTGQLVRSFEGHTGLVHAVAFSPDGHQIVSGSLDQTLRLWDRATGQLVRTFEGHTESVKAVAFSPDGTQVVSGGDDETLRLWDLATGQLVQTFKGHTDPVRAVALSPEGTQVISGLATGTLQLWDRATGQLVRTFEGHTEWVNAVAFSPDGDQVISGGAGTVRLWNRATGQLVHTLCCHSPGGVKAVAVSPDGSQVISGGFDDTLRWWDRATGQLVRTIRSTYQGLSKAVTAVAVSPDGTQVVSGRDDGVLQLWNRITGQLVRTFEGPHARIRSVAFSPDGAQFVTGSGSDTLHLWDRATGKVVRTFKGHTGSLRAVAFSPDGTQVVSSGNDDTLRLWDHATGQLVRTYRGHTDSVNALAVSPDGTEMISASSDGTLRIWKLHTGEIVATLIGFKDGEWVAYTPDNYYVASAKGDQYVTFRVGNKVYDFAQYASIYKKPKIVAKILRGEDIQSDIAAIKQETGIDLNTTSVANLLPPELIINFFSGEGVDPEARNQIIEVPRLTLSAVAIDRVHGVSRIVLTINEQTVKEVQADPKGGDKEFRFKIPLILKHEDNVVSLVAYNSKNIPSRPEEIHLTYQKAIFKGLSLPEIVKRFFGKSRSWAVVIGINDYSKESNGFDYLPYAVNDAKRVKDYLINYLGFSDERIFSLYNKDATKEKIEALLGDDLPSKLSEEDRLFVFFSGHGATKPTTRINPNTGQHQKIGYLVPVDGQTTKLHSTAISMNQFSAFSDLNPARQILFVIDACYSGIAGVVRKGKEKKLAQHTRKQVETFIQSRGRQIMTAGTDRETTVMSRKWNNHSVFTYFLLHGLQGKADYNKDQVISVGELELYLGTEVPGQANQTPQVFDLENTQGQFVFYPEGSF